MNYWRLKLHDSGLKSSIICTSSRGYAVWPKLEPLRDQIQGYLDKNISILNIARLLEVSYTTIHNYIRKNKMLKGSEKAKILAQKQKIEKVKLHLTISNLVKGGRGVKRAIDDIKVLVLPHFDPSFRNLGHNTFILRIRYKDYEELDNTIKNLLEEIQDLADLKNCTSEETHVESMDRPHTSWG